MWAGRVTTFFQGAPYMRLRNRVAVGCEAGVLAGASVIAIFLLQDLLSIQPLSTPTALAGQWFGPGNIEMDLSLVAKVAAAIAFGTRLVAYTLFHFVAFMCLGVAAAAVLRFNGSWVGSLSRGALFGVSACSLVYYGGAVVAEFSVTSRSPDLGAVLGANLMAGLVIGGFLHWTAMVQASSSEAEEA